MNFKIPLIFVFFMFLVVCSICCTKLSPLNNPYNGKTTAVFNPEKKYGTVIDVDGNVYKTIVIGQQTWMAENLRVIHYRNGDEIPNLTDDEMWGDTDSGAYCNYGNTTDIDTIATYGRLYNWYAVHDSRGLTPPGWRIPTIDDWYTLFTFLGGDQVAGDKLKESNYFNIHWHEPNKANNSSGFTALPGGWREFYKKTAKIGYLGCWWAADATEEYVSPRVIMFYNSPGVYVEFMMRENGYSVRCVKE